MFIRFYYLWLFMFFCLLQMRGQQIANYVTNGSFEEKYNNCNFPFTIAKAKGWLSIDSTNYAGTYCHICANSIPLNGNTYQSPNSGSAYLLSNFYDKTFGIRGYMKNRLKASLQNGKVYCVKFYVNICNTSPRGIDGFAAYFGDASIDTIKYCTLPITYLTPQVSNPQGNVITDTLNWVPITGTFVATGTEKYLLLGNFYSDLATTTASINTPYFPDEWTDVCIDDVSCIEMDVAAYAGPDKRFFVGDSVYLGRELDFAIDPYCFWYKLPNTNTAIDTASGIWVKPTSTSTYVVRQELECNTVKWDTVVVYKDAVGLEKLKIINEELKISPNPGDDRINVSLEGRSLSSYFETAEILNTQGRVLKQLRIAEAEKWMEISTDDLVDGIYLLRLMDDKNENLVLKKLAVQH